MRLGHAVKRSYHTGVASGITRGLEGATTQGRST